MDSWPGPDKGVNESVEARSLPGKWQWRADGGQFQDFEEWLSKVLESEWIKNRSAVVRVKIHGKFYDVYLERFEQVLVSDVRRTRPIQRLDSTGKILTKIRKEHKPRPNEEQAVQPSPQKEPLAGTFELPIRCTATATQKT